VKSTASPPVLLQAPMDWDGMSEEERDRFLDTVATAILKAQTK
jgi:hypothetical protein